MKEKAEERQAIPQRFSPPWWTNTINVFGNKTTSTAALSYLFELYVNITC